MTQAMAKKLFAKWTKIIGFDGWRINFYTVRAEYIDDTDEAIGHMAEYRPYPRATVRIALGQPDDVVEYAIVHELLHVKLIPLNQEHANVRELLGAEARQLAGSSYHATQEMLVETWGQSLLEAFGYGV